jgi:hypothetical protein
MSEQLERWHYLGGQRHSGYLSDCAVCVEHRRVGGQKFGKDASPEESLCGEEEALVTGHEEVVTEVPEGGQGPAGEPDPTMAEWVRHCRGVGKNRARAYADALLLVEKQFDAWRQAFPHVAEEAFRQQQREAVTPREREMLTYYAAGFGAVLRDLLAAASSAATR